MKLRKAVRYAQPSKSVHCNVRCGFNNGPDGAETGLPKCPREQTFAVLVGMSQTCRLRIFSAPVGMSQRCQKRTLLRSNTSGMSVKGVLTTQPQPSVRQPTRGTISRPKTFGVVEGDRMKSKDMRL